MQFELMLDGYNADKDDSLATAFRIVGSDNQSESPPHSHRKGQLILALHGGVTCRVLDALWSVPKNYALWIPGGIEHSNHVTRNARLCFVFIEPNATVMPDYCCTLALSALVREVILHLCTTVGQPDDAARRRMVQVLFDQLPQTPNNQYYLPYPGDKRLRRMVEYMRTFPDNMQSQHYWAVALGMSERNLSRLIIRETGMNFRRWKQQLQLILAIEYLLEGESVQQTAVRLGYDSATAFINMFKNCMKQTPGHWLSILNDNKR